MSRCLIFAAILFSSSLCNVQADINSANYFVGLSPSLTAEPFYESGEFDVNILPLVYQRNLLDNIDIRMIGLVNYGIRKNENKLSHFGFELAFPRYLFGNTPLPGPSEGFFVAPIFSIAQEQIKKELHVGLWVEPAYQFTFSQNYSISLGLQLGVTWIEKDMVDHFGIKFIFGRWF